MHSTRGTTVADAQTTRTKDELYDLISIAYHNVQGAWNYDQYIEDARERGDDELADFFDDVKETHAEIGERAKGLLSDRL